MFPSALVRSIPCCTRSPDRTWPVGLSRGSLEWILLHVLACFPWLNTSAFATLSSRPHVLGCPTTLPPPPRRVPRLFPRRAVGTPARSRTSCGAVLYGLDIIILGMYDTKSQAGWCQAQDAILCRFSMCSPRAGLSAHGLLSCSSFHGKNIPVKGIPL